LSALACLAAGPGLNSLRRRGIDPAVLVVKLRTSPEAFDAPIYAARDSRLCADTATSENSPDALFDSFLRIKIVTAWKAGISHTIVIGFAVLNGITTTLAGNSACRPRGLHA
jgi:hypothetical protein